MGDESLEGFAFAVRKGLVSKVAEYVAQGVNVNTLHHGFFPPELLDAGSGFAVERFGSVGPQVLLTSLHIALANAHWDVATMLLDVGANPSARIPSPTAVAEEGHELRPGGWTPLHIVAARLVQSWSADELPAHLVQRLEMKLALRQRRVVSQQRLAAQADAPTATDLRRQDVLDDRKATHRLDRPRALNMMKVLVTEGADQRAATGALAQTALHIVCGGRSDDAILLEAVKWMVKEGGFDPEMRDADGNTCVCVAAKNSNLALVQWLVTEGGVDIHALNNQGQNCVHLAAAGGAHASLDLVKVLVDDYKVDCTIVDEDGHNPLAIAARNKNTAIVDFFVLELGLSTRPGWRARVKEVMAGGVLLVTLIQLHSFPFIADLPWPDDYDVMTRLALWTVFDFDSLVQTVFLWFFLLSVSMLVVAAFVLASFSRSAAAQRQHQLLLENRGTSEAGAPSSQQEPSAMANPVLSAVAFLFSTILLVPMLRIFLGVFDCEIASDDPTELLARSVAPQNGDAIPLPSDIALYQCWTQGHAGWAAAVGLLMALYLLWVLRLVRVDGLFHKLSLAPPRDRNAKPLFTLCGSQVFLPRILDWSRDDPKVGLSDLHRFQKQASRRAVLEPVLLALRIALVALSLMLTTWPGWIAVGNLIVCILLLLLAVLTPLYKSVNVNVFVVAVYSGLVWTCIAALVNTVAVAGMQQHLTHRSGGSGERFDTRDGPISFLAFVLVWIFSVIVSSIIARPYFLGLKAKTGLRPRSLERMATDSTMHVDRAVLAMEEAGGASAGAGAGSGTAAATDAAAKDARDAPVHPRGTGRLLMPAIALGAAGRTKRRPSAQPMHPTPIPVRASGATRDAWRLRMREHTLAVLYSRGDLILPPIGSGKRSDSPPDSVYGVLWHRHGVDEAYIEDLMLAAALPEPWSLVVAPDGFVYFRHDRDGTVQWQDPRIVGSFEPVVSRTTIKVPRLSVPPRVTPHQSPGGEDAGVGVAASSNGSSAGSPSSPWRRAGLSIMASRRVRRGGSASPPGAATPVGNTSSASPMRRSLHRTMTRGRDMVNHLLNEVATPSTGPGNMSRLEQSQQQQHPGTAAAPQHAMQPGTMAAAAVVAPDLRREPDWPGKMMQMRDVFPYANDIALEEMLRRSGGRVDHAVALLLSLQQSVDLDGGYVEDAEDPGMDPAVVRVVDDVISGVIEARSPSIHSASTGVSDGLSDDNEELPSAISALAAASSTAQSSPTQRVASKLVDEVMVDATAANAGG